MISRRQLLHGWVQYMKNNNIVSSVVQAHGELKYRRRPTKTDLANYLQYATDMTESSALRIIAAAQREVRADAEYLIPRDLDVNIWNRPAGVNEEIRDRLPRPLSDVVIERTFDLVVKELNKPPPKQRDAGVTTDRVMDIVRGSMLPAQRQYLWDLLANAR